LRLRTEENAGRADHVLAGPTSRNRWAASYLVVDLVGTVAIVLAGGLGTGAAYAGVVGDASQVPRLAGAALSTVPAAMVLMGVTVALFGLIPRAALVAWGVLAGVAVIVFFGELLRLPFWVRDLSPFTHIPAAPAEPVRWEPLLALTAVAVALVVVGLWGLRRRDIAAG
jgi:ABC-2 type transport system permease protein